jgi:hypothetical protein
VLLGAQTRCLHTSNSGFGQRSIPDGTSEPINLTPEQKGDVITVLGSMAADVAGGHDDLPDVCSSSGMRYGLT